MDLVATGLIKKKYGLRGQFKVVSLSGELDHFSRLERIYIRKGDRFLPFNVQSVGRAGSYILMKLEGVDSPEKVRELQGLELWIPRDKAAPLKEGEYYHADICRCDVYQKGEKIGRVKAVCETSYADMLEIVTPAGGSMMIPLLEMFVGEIDIDGGRIFLKEEFTIP